MKDLSGLVESTVKGLGFELVEFETSPRARLLRVFIDCLERPVTIDDCERVSHQLTHLFEVEHVDYDRLEVSSPGLDRPLKKPADFQRFAGQRVQLRLRVALALPSGVKAGGRRNFIGTLLGCDGENVRLATAEGELVFPLANIDKARLVPLFETERHGMGE
ncbi:MAG: ribosome maturation factor RimP [Rhodocyclaceae bacterium]|nr:ribosome maturation factor RimP [Rhodocyclaceae bacterium]